MTNTAGSMAATATALPTAGERITVGIGDHVTIPPNFKYAEVFRRGRPHHGTPGELGTYDSFYIKHPPMECSRRAKIFAPFDALAGFSQCIKDKQVLYEERRSLTESEREELDNRVEGSRTAPPLPLHRTYGSRIRRYINCKLISKSIEIVCKGINKSGIDRDFPLAC